MRKILLRIVLTSCFVLVATGAMAQSENAIKNVSVMNLDYMVKESPKTQLGTVVSAVLDVLSDKTTTEEPGYTDALRASVITALGYVRRFSVSDGRQVSPNDATNIIVDGTINYISITRELKESSDKKSKVPQFYAQIGLTLNLKNPTTGTLLNSHVFEITKSSWSWVKSNDTAIKDALEALRRQIGRYYNSAYPYTAHILERGAEKKDKQKEVYIDLGLSHRIYEGIHFDVYAIGSIGGKETRKEIGRLKVKSVEGDEVSLCKVSSGGKEIKAAIDAGQQLLIISTD